MLPAWKRKGKVKKGKACKNVGCGEGDINIQPKTKFRVQNIRNFEEIG